MYKRLERLLRNHKNVEMIYVFGENKITKRIVSLYVVNEQEVMGYCHLRGHVRKFKVEQILAISPSQTSRSKKTVTS